MSEIKKALLLIGSPKGPKSTSNSLGSFLIEKLEERGINTKKAYIYRMLNREEKQKELFTLIKESDLIILSFPLYVDSLPSPVIKAMELISNNHSNEKNHDYSEKSLVAISNSGFPESEQITIAMKICEQFSIEVGYRWLGGLKVGGGPFIHGKKLEERGKMVQHIIDGLIKASDDLIKGEKISDEVVDFLSKPFISKRIYKLMGNMGWYFQSWTNWKFRLKKRPYKKN